MYSPALPYSPPSFPLAAEHCGAVRAAGRASPMRSAKAAASAGVQGNLEMSLVYPEISRIKFTFWKNQSGFLQGEK